MTEPSPLGGLRTARSPAMTAQSPVPVLVVDDNPAKRLALKSVLTPLGHDIVEAGSGEAALRCVMARDFAVILLDVRMPVMNGFETAALIRQRRQSESTPIIFITAYGSDELVTIDGYAEGAVDFMYAPVPPHELRAKVSVFADLFSKTQQLAVAAREAQLSADQLRLLTDAAPIGIFQTDAANQYVYTNPRWTEITGISPEAAIGQQWTVIMDGEEQGRLPVAAADQPEISHRFNLETDTGVRILLVTSRAVPGSNGGTAGWVGTLADVTAEAGVEEAMGIARDRANEASRLKSDFLANMSHEIRTPMNGVIGMTDLLLETNLDARQRDFAQAVRNSGEALLTIINDILDFSKVEAGKLEIEDIEFDVRTIVEDVVDMLSASAQAKGLELLAVIDRFLPAAVNGDPGRVRQVLTNLVGNAIKFTQAGEIVVRVTEEEGRGDATVVRFEVSDTGDGIAADKLDQVFQPFVQADTSTSRRYGGTGLGLAISSQLVDLMGGKCGVSSRLGIGSDFWFTIRVCVDTVLPPQLLALPDDGLSGVDVLVADDNATHRGILTQRLTDWGMVVSTVDSGASMSAALRAAAAAGRPMAVALVDRSMSGLEGPDLLDALSADPTVTTRLVFMTEWGHDRPEADSAYDRVSTSLSKPVHRGDLRLALRATLGLQAPHTDPAKVPAGLSLPASGVDMGRVLVVEDNAINRKVAVAMLASAGYVVDTVLDGEAAVTAVSSQPYDAILMDCQMPKLNGYEATAAIRVLEGSDRHTPIIALTASARREDRERCLAEGMDGYLSKPVSKDALLAQVAQSLRRDQTVNSAVDPTVLEELRLLPAGVQHDLVSELVDLFVQEAEPRLVHLGEALEAGDAAAVGRLAHLVKGSSAQLGGRRLAHSCDRLEVEAATGDLSGSRALLRQVQAEYHQLVRALRDLASGKTAAGQDTTPGEEVVAGEAVAGETQPRPAIPSGS